MFEFGIVDDFGIALLRAGGSSYTIIAEPEPVEGVAVSAAFAFDKLRLRLVHGGN